MTTFFNTTEDRVRTRMIDCPVCKGATVRKAWKLRCPYCDGSGWVYAKNDTPVPFGAGIWRDDVYQGEATA